MNSVIIKVDTAFGRDTPAVRINAECLNNENFVSLMRALVVQRGKLGFWTKIESLRGKVVNNLI